MVPIAITVPCYNEANRFRSDVFTEFVRAHPDVRFIFVDDGSTDETAGVLSVLANANQVNFRFVSLEKNRGKAEAVRFGMLAGVAEGAKYVGYWDADLATPLSAITEFARHLECNSELLLVMGARVRLLGRNIVRKTYRHYLGRVFATCASAVLRLPVYDTQCGAKLFLNSEPVVLAFKEPFISRWVFDVEVLARLLRTGGLNPEAVIYEFPLTEWHDIKGSKVRARDFWIALWDLARIHFVYRRYHSP